MVPQYVGQVVNIPQCCDGPSPFQIFLGDAKSMYLKVLNGGYGADPVDLTLCSAITVTLPNADGTYLSLTVGAGVTIDTAVLGKFHAAISAVQSALLNVGELQDVDATFVFPTQTFTVTFKQALSVYQVT